MFFDGKFEYTIDDRGRVNVPNEYREILNKKGSDRVVITNFVVRKTRCLEVYPEADWIKFEEQLVAKSQLKKDLRDFIEGFYIPGARMCQVDKQNRVLIPPSLRTYAGLDKEVTLAGALRKFRVWDRQAFAPMFESGERFAMENPDVLAEIGL